MIPRICQTLFSKMEEEKDESTTFHTEASYLEIYNEKVRDLLQVRMNCHGYYIAQSSLNANLMGLV